MNPEEVEARLLILRLRYHRIDELKEKCNNRLIRVRLDKLTGKVLAEYSRILQMRNQIL